MHFKEVSPCYSILRVDLHEFFMDGVDGGHLNLHTFSGYASGWLVVTMLSGDEVVDSVEHHGAVLLVTLPQRPSALHSHSTL